MGQVRGQRRRRSGGLSVLPLVMPLLGLAASACDRQTSAPPAWTPTTESELTSLQKRQLERMLVAKELMFTELKSALLKAMATSGATGAIAVCRDQAPQIAEQVSQLQNLRIGRTSFRLRNPANTPPVWAEESIAARSEEAVYFVGERNELAGLLPIRMLPLCLTCHGPAESIAPEVRDAVARSYSEDQATGFNEGDLRGWFWVEVPEAER